MHPVETAPTRTRKSPVERRLEILEAAKRVAVRQGLVSLTLKSVGLEAGVASSLVAHYFPTMGQLTIEVFGGLAGAELDALLEMQERDGDETERMRTLVNWLLRPERLDVTAVWLDAILLGRTSEELAVEIRLLLDRWQDAVSSAIVNGNDAGEFRCDRPEIVAAHILSLIDGLNTNSLVSYRDTSGLESYLRELIEDELDVARGTFAA